MSSTTAQYLLRTTTETFETLALLFPDETLSPAQREATLDVTVSVEFRGPENGRLVVQASESVLPAIAANMLGENESQAASLQRDALGEVANVICGNVLPRIAGVGAVFRLAAPRVHAPGAERTRADDTPVATVTLGVEDGRVALALYLFERRERSAA